jgi:hypothetical protein
MGYAEFKTGLFIFVSSSVQKLEQKHDFLLEVPKSIFLDFQYLTTEFVLAK